MEYSTDRIRSKPVLWGEKGPPDPLSVLEFRMAGYVTGNRTLYRGLYQLMAGQRLVDGGPVTYYRYLPERASARKEEALSDILDGVFRRLVERLAGRPVVVMLSGGLDSRLILCKLHELKYDRLTAITYGMKGNWESRIALQVAKVLGVPIRFIRIMREDFARFWRSPVRRDYWAFREDCSSVPNVQDLYPLWSIRKELHPGTVIINGQSGDFITGGHIPPALMRNPVLGRELVEAIIAKHFRLWRSLAVYDPAIRVEVASQLNVLPNTLMTPEEATGLFEYWEWRERQTKYVVSGQRIYDFLGFDWELPLWDDALMDFFARVPYQLRFGQTLYRQYLEAWDYCGLLTHRWPQVWRWPGASLAAVPVANLAGLVAGRRGKQWVYDSLRRRGHYGYLYTAPDYHRVKGDIRGATSLMAREYLEGV